jgi:UDP:flavonoid glycosyltransferase YjiC (YdhE family)
MRIAINTFGTRGDIQPTIALGLGLQRAGHNVRIVTHEIFGPFVREHGLDFYALGLDPRQVVINQALVELGNNPLRISRWLQENYESALRDIFEATLAANADAELMLNSGLSFAGWHVAEKLQIPAIATLLWPMTPSHQLPGAVGKIPPAWLPFRGWANYYSTKLFNQLFYNLMLPLVNQCREEILDLPSMSARYYWSLDSPHSATPIIYGYSPSVVPRPSDWGGYQQVAGYWFLDLAEDYEPDAQLLEFLATGPPPVVVGFGSMVDRQQETSNRLVTDALQETGQRAILLGGWSELGLGDLPDFIFRADAVPHDWLLPRVSAVVHHGGAGTTAAALRAGVPGVVVPWFGDQFFWGWRVQELGAGPQPIPRKALTTANLAGAIRQAVDDDSIKHRAAHLSQQIRAEDGVASAVRLIEAFARQGHF